MDAAPRFRFTFVSNSAEIASALSTYSDSSIEEIDIHLASLDDALPVARSLLEAGVEVIIGGGATGKLLRRKLDGPVVHIARSTLDLLRALNLAKRFGPDLCLTSYESTTEGIDLFERLLSVRIHELVFTSMPELVAGLTRMTETGVSCVVGSALSKEAASSVGLQGIVVYPGKEAILQALQDARTLAAAQRKERQDAARLRLVLESISEGVVGMDTEERLTLLNEAAARLLGLDPETAVGRPLPSVLQDAGLTRAMETGLPDMDQIRRLAGQDMVVSTRPVVMHGVVQAAVATIKPVSRIESIDRKVKEKLYAKGFVARYGLGHLKGQSAAMVHLRSRAVRYALTEAAVLIQGETGCGKEILAQGMHIESPRRDQPFVAVNCSALPETLLESELFGYEEGAFTGARRGGKPGLFELSSKGTIFLDEIADISPQLQVRLLRVLEEKEVMRLGGDRIIPVDVRIISSASQDLVQEVRVGRFRSDLYFRLAVLRLELPALRQRPEDLPDIMEELFVRNDLDRDQALALLTPATTQRLQAYSWPGNVRELDSLVRRFLALGGRAQAGGPELLQELLDEVEQVGLEHSPLDPTSPSREGIRLKDQVVDFEREVIQRVLADSRHNRREAARRLGMSVNTLWRKLKG
jgi:propionate catabolism operon transcriptional regulator